MKLYDDLVELIGSASDSRTEAAVLTFVFAICALFFAAVAILLGWLAILGLIHSPVITLGVLVGVGLIVWFCWRVARDATS